MEILKLSPTFKDYIWGGNKMREIYGFQSDLDRISEAWMLSCHKDGKSIVNGGKYDGMTLDEVISQNPEYLGEKGRKYDSFPILIKFIDALDNLSVQVHPDDEYALKNEGEYGKTECWYILDCEEDAELIYGFKDKISKEQFEASVKDNSFLDYVNKVNVKPGDFFFIEAGTLHAIGKGILLAEIQQNSNTTYRVYDYGRIGKDGKPRDLHVNKALDVTLCEKPKYDTKPFGEKEYHEGYTSQLLTKCELFKVYTIDVKSEYAFNADNTSLVSLLISDGSGSVDGIPVKAGDSLFIPASYGCVSVNGKIDLIKTSL
ncbi:MAG: class I mannose-6-phosphate isomerase [Clostridiales bacterium]|nr:class I mannose-6-phosphate isomerase [Clostridiales bacterium]